MQQDTRHQTAKLQKIQRIDPASVPEFALHPRFECNSRGVFWIGIKTAKDGQAVEAEPLRLSDPIDVIGSGTDEAGAYYRVICYTDKASRSAKTCAIAAADIGSNPGWQTLQRRGITILSGRAKREKLADYLQEQGGHTQYRISDKAGWHGKAYILPNGQTLGDTDTVYNGNASQGQAYAESGTLADWQHQVARHAAGNSRLLLALGTALAAPLLHSLHEPGGGFHLYGDSSDGKTTAAMVALSVWGLPEKLKLAWNGTALGFANIALARNDGLLVLDEIGEAKPKIVGNTVYSVLNGQSKIQAAAEGGNRALSQWRVLLLSTGEYAMQAYMEAAGEKWEAGQAVRLPSIPAATLYGIYEHLHGFPSGGALSDYLLETIAHQHGTAGRAWIAKLQSLPVDTVKAARDAFLHTLPELDGQALRVARRFALVSAALELATDITGLQQGVGLAGIRQCFDDWLIRNGQGKFEDRSILKAATDFMQQYAFTGRFATWNAQDFDHAPNHAGYWKGKDGGHDCEREYWLIPAVFEMEICQGKDKEKVCRVLHGIGWLKRYSDNRFRFQRYGKGRFYVFDGAEPPDDND